MDLSAYAVGNDSPDVQSGVRTTGKTVNATPIPRQWTTELTDEERQKLGLPPKVTVPTPPSGSLAAMASRSNFLNSGNVSGLEIPTRSNSAPSPDELNAAMRVANPPHPYAPPWGSFMSDVGRNVAAPLHAEESNIESEAGSGDYGAAGIDAARNAVQIPFLPFNIANSVADELGKRGIMEPEAAMMLINLVPEYAAKAFDLATGASNGNPPNSPISNDMYGAVQRVGEGGAGLLAGAGAVAGLGAMGSNLDAIQQLRNGGADAGGALPTTTPAPQITPPEPQEIAPQFVPDKTVPPAPTPESMGTFKRFVWENVKPEDRLKAMTQGTPEYIDAYSKFQKTHIKVAKIHETSADEKQRLADKAATQAAKKKVSNQSNAVTEGQVQSSIPIQPPGNVPIVAGNGQVGNVAPAIETQGVGANGGNSVQPTTPEQGQVAPPLAQGNVSAGQGQNIPSTGENAPTGVQNVPIDNIKTDPTRFQNRTELDQDRVNRMAANFDPNQLDPVVLWKDPKTGDDFILSGHHRLASAEQAGQTNIPSRYFQGTEAQAVDYAKNLSNSNRAMETPTERAALLRNLRTQGANTDDFQANEGKNWNRINAYASLNPTGDTIRALQTFEKTSTGDTTDNLGKIAQWIGEARQQYPEISDAQENEMFRYLKNGGIDALKNKVEFFNRLDKVVNNTVFDKNAVLNLENTLVKSDVMQDYDKQTADAKAGVDKAQKEFNDKHADLVKRGATDADLTRVLKPYQDNLTLARQNYMKLLQDKGTVRSAERAQGSIFSVSELIDKLNKSDAATNEVTPGNITQSPKNQGIEGFGQASATLPGVQQAARFLQQAGAVQKFTPYQAVLNDYSLRMGQNLQAANEFIRDFNASVDPVTAEAITVIREAHSDPSIIAEQYKNLSEKLNDLTTRKGDKRQIRTIKTYLPVWKRALEAVTNDEKPVLDLTSAMARKFDEGGTQGVEQGVMNELREDYIKHQWQSGSFNREAPAGATSSRLATSFASAKPRTFPTYYDGIMAGGIPTTLNAGNLWGEWLKSKDNVLAGRVFATALTNTKDESGYPLAIRTARMVNNGESFLWKSSPDVSLRDYKPVNIPTFHDYLFRKDIAERVQNAFGTSWIETSPNAIARALKGISAVNSFAKQNLLSVAPFHIPTTAEHAFGHMINPFSLEPVDLINNEAQADAVAHGLQINQDNDFRNFSEGVMAKGSLVQDAIDAALKKIPGNTDARYTLDNLTDWTFTKFIPELKMKTYNAVIMRNLTRFAKDIERGKVTVDDVKFTTAQEINNAFGELNYKALGRNPTVQSFLKLVLLAPDFLEARARFTGEALTGIYSKTYHEQSYTLLRLALGTMVMAQITNMLINKKPDFTHPFQAHVGNKYYGIRTQATDLWDFMQDAKEDFAQMKANKNFFMPGGFFLRTRLSPISNAAIEGATGKDYAGRTRDALQEIKDFIGMATPIASHAIPGAPGGRPGFTVIDQLIQSLGVTSRSAKPFIPKKQH